MNNRPTTTFAWALLACLLASPATAQIYRCTEGDTTVFSDIPCSESAQLHKTSGLSVIRAAKNLDEIAASNKAFLEQRQQQLAQQRERAAQRRDEARQLQQRRELAEDRTRYRTVVGRLDRRQFQADGSRQVDRRTRARRDRQADQAGRDQTRRRTLLSRSGGNRENILR
ncbi:MAG: DUF4124 domain-containing protein [Wenzhouxiangellaceae bacterium]